MLTVAASVMLNTGSNAGIPQPLDFVVNPLQHGRKQEEGLGICPRLSSLKLKIFYGH